jgi:phenylacetate-CoA ligase
MAPAPAPDVPRRLVPLRARLRYAVGPLLQRLYETRTQERIRVLDVGQAQIEDVYRRIERFRPAYIVGYTSTVATIADELFRSQLRLTRPLSAVVVVAESLTPLRRHLIERYFDAPIANRYGQRELAFWVAQSCPETPDRFHMTTELAVWEIVRDDGTRAEPGEHGRIVLTSLHNYAMPFIRYDTGDRAVAGSAVCACGRGFPLVEQLEGRSVETLRLPSGKEISPVVLGHYLFVYRDYVDAIRHYQLVVEGDARVRLLVVPSHPLGAEERERMERDLVELVNGELHVDVEEVEEIGLEPSGKRPIIKFAPRDGAVR